MVNESGLAPLGRAVLVRHDDSQDAKRLAAIGLVMGAGHADRSLMLEQEAVVVEVGPACWPDEPPRAKPGDRVLIAKMSGYMAPGEDGGKYRLVNDRDIFCRLTKKKD